MDAVVSKSILAGQIDDLEYWMSKEPGERIAAVEMLRRQPVGGGRASGSRIQRVCRVTSLHLPSGLMEDS